MIFKYLKNRSLYLNLRLFLGLVLLIVIASILAIKIVPFGSATYQRSWPSGMFSARTLISDFRPGIRFEDSDSGLKVLGDPLYFNFHSPRKFDNLEIKLKYKENLYLENPIVELGILKGDVNGNYELKPIQNRLIDRLKYDWNRLSDSETLLVLQRDSTYDDVNDFFLDMEKGRLENCGQDAFSCVAFYNYNPNFDYKIPAYSQVYPLVISQALRADHRFYVYFPQGEWKLDLSFRHLALKENVARVIVDVYSGNTLLDSRELISDSSDISNEDFNNSERQGSAFGKISLGGRLEEGKLVRFEIKANDDIVTEKIESSSDKLIFINKLWPVYSEGLELYTDSSNITLTAQDVASLGKVIFDEKDYDFNKTYENFYLESDNRLGAINRLSLEKSSSIIQLNGLISLDLDNYYNPLPRRIDRFFSSDSQFNYVVSGYNIPKRSGEYKEVVVDFDLAGAYYEKEYYSFILSIPGLSPENDDNYIEISEVLIKANGKSIIDKVREVIRRF